ncbi:fasciclin domain-containing protein [Lewinella sp. IMCC34191]|uniref:fasciclin domain-containing protein n=1 Tax=Lewinella sp. IMCC34191 TaxID=2259172 RepID=UPI000E22964C|nr:fasciclin domain-containing protein [Lewinella sp. IMCC34191]
MKHVLPILFTAVLAVFGGVLTAQSNTVVDIISASENHTTLQEALTPELITALSGAGPFTVFAPTDAAFEMLSEDDLSYLTNEDNVDSLVSVLQYHVIADSLPSDSLRDGMMYPTLNEGDSLYVRNDTTPNGALFVNGVLITQTEITASNGVVYIIDAVLMQPVATVVDVIMDTDTLSTLEAAVVAAGLDDDLMGEGLFTVFAPSNLALANISPDSLNTLTTSGDLETILEYHVVPGRYTSADLMDGMMLMTLGGEMLEVTISGDSVLVDSSLIIMADMIADNGVVHVIDSILLPMAITSVDEPAFAREVNIMPNPATSLFYVTLPNSILNSAVLTLRDFSGRTIVSRRATSDREPLDVGALPTGTYLLEIRANAGVIQRKVMVQR